MSTCARCEKEANVSFFYRKDLRILDTPMSAFAPRTVPYCYACAALYLNAFNHAHAPNAQHSMWTPEEVQAVARAAKSPSMLREMT